jgi:hypothetical protein
MLNKELTVPIAVFAGTLLIVLIYFYTGKPKMVTDVNDKGETVVVGKKAIPMALIVSSVLGVLTIVVQMFMDNKPKSDDDYGSKYDRKSDRYDSDRYSSDRYDSTRSDRSDRDLRDMDMDRDRGVPRLYEMYKSPKKFKMGGCSPCKDKGMKYHF